MAAVVLSFRCTVFMGFVLFPSTKGKNNRRLSFRGKLSAGHLLLEDLGDLRRVTDELFNNLPVPPDNQVSRVSVGLDLFINSIQLRLSQVIMVAPDASNHLLPFRSRRCRAGDIDETDVFQDTILHRFQNLVGCFAGAAPSSPEIDQDGIPGIFFQDVTQRICTVSRNLSDIVWMLR